MDMFKGLVSNSLQVGMGKMMDKMGRPGVPYMNSLLSGEPIGNWHMTIGNPMNPILAVGNLICDSVDIKFPDNALSYGEFPTKFEVVVSLKQAMPRDRAGLEVAFNAGKQRLYYAPKNVEAIKGKWEGGNPRNFGGYSTAAINTALHRYYEFMPKAHESGMLEEMTQDPDGKTLLMKNANSKSNKDAAKYGAVFVTDAVAKLLNKNDKPLSESEGAVKLKEQFKLEQHAKDFKELGNEAQSSYSKPIQTQDNMSNLQKVETPKR
jgi:hypothetical protein